MTFTFLAPIVGTIVVVLLTGTAPAFAQDTGALGPPGGLFGGGAGERRVRETLDFSVSLVQAKDGDAAAQLGGVGDTSAAVGGYSTMFVGEGDYHWNGPRVQVGATGASVLRRYNRLDEVRSVSHSAGLGVSTEIGPRTTLLANQTATYSPSYLNALFPGDPVRTPGDAAATAPDYVVDRSESYQYRTTVVLTQGLSRRSRVTATGDVNYTNYLHETGGRRDLNWQSIHGQFLNQVTRRAAVKAGYAYRTGRFGYVADRLASEVDPAPLGSGVSATEHGVDVGVDYSRRISATRTTVLRVNVGTSMLTVPVPALGAAAGRFVRVAGDVEFGWQFKRWQTRGVLRRGVEYVAQLNEPVFVDGATAELGGFLTPRFEVLMTARYSSGASALRTGALTFDTYGADARLQYALSRSLAIYGQYLYYFYDFQRSGQLPAGVPPGLERHGLRAGFTVWVPLVRR